MMEELLSSSDYKLIEKYDRLMIVETKAIATRSKHLDTILSLSRIKPKKSWTKLSQDDIDDMIATVVSTYSSNGQETHTTYDHKKILKIFFRWLKLGSRSFRKVGDPPETKNVKMLTVKDTIVRESLVTPKDLDLLMQHTFNLRDKALLATHYEAGTRTGELLSLKIKHVSFVKHGIKIAVDGKTGARPILLIECVPYLSKYLATHPLKDDPEAPLWINLHSKWYGKPLTQPAFLRILKRITHSAGVKKRVYPHLFRHSEATRTATMMNEAMMRKRHGWSATSKMPSKYAHIIQEDVDNAILKHHGFTPETTVARTPKVCPSCKNPNAFDSDICDNCSKPLTLDKAILLEDESQRDYEEMKSQVGEMRKMMTELFSELKKEHRDVIFIFGMKFWHLCISFFHDR